MDSHVGIDDNNKNNNGRTKAMAATIPMAGIVVAAAFLSGLLSLIDSYPTAIAQLAAEPPLLNITGIDPNATTGGGGGAQSSACAPTQTGGGEGETTTGGAATTGTNATSTTTAGGGTGGNQSTTSEVRLHIEEACMALQAGDTQGVLMHLNLALNALAGGGIRGDNMTSTSSGTTDSTTTGGGG